MKTVIKVAFAFAVLLVVSGVPGLQADEGSIPIFKQTTITVAGHYVVTRDFSFATGHGVTILANNVTLDLNGHTITGPACTGAGERVIAISPSTATKGIVIRNGRLIAACDGIGAGAQNRITVRIERVEVSGASGPGGIVIDAAEHAEILGCHVHDVTGTGIKVGGTSAAFGGKVSDNRVEHIGLNGIYLDGMVAGEVRRNEVTDYGSGAPGEIGIYLSAATSAWGAGGNLVEENTVTALPGGTDDDGIRANDTSPYNLILNNVVTGCRYGIYSYGDGTRIERNVVSTNSLSGIRVGNGTTGSFAHVEENQSQSNTGAGGCGINFTNGNGHVFRNNNLRNNTTGVCNGALGTNSDGGGNIL